jgi:hypothetical protein
MASDTKASDLYIHRCENYKFHFFNIFQNFILLNFITAVYYIPILSLF